MKRRIDMIKYAKKLVLLLFLASCLLAATGCSTNPKNTAEETSAPDMHQKSLLVVSFGTSYDNRELSIGGIEKTLQTAYPDYDVRRAFTSQIIIDKLKERDNLTIDNVRDAMDRLVADGVKEVVIQPTHVMDGFEYNDIIAEVTSYEDHFESLKIGKNLLTSDTDYQEVASVIMQEMKAYDVEGTAIVLMGHGTEASSNVTYAKMQKVFTDMGYTRCFVGTVESTPTLADVIALVKTSDAKKVVLAPLMIVAGDHATNDMAGDEDDSWKKEFKAAGFEVECVLKGLGQMQGIQNLIVMHAGEATAPVAVAKTATAKSAEQTLSVSEKSKPTDGKKIKDGTYKIEVSSNSSMFRIVEAQLTAAGGEMTAVLTLSGDGYEKLYMGTGEMALADTDDKCIYFIEDTQGRYTYKVPVAALDQDIDCAAWSTKKKTWYDRVLVFQSSLIPKDAILPA
jgi:sirohydrochlorin cobaltochelatase